MTTISVQQGGASALPTAAELEAFAKAAMQMEEVLREASAIFAAIHSSGMLDAAPAEEHDAHLHNTACVFWTCCIQRVRQWEDRPGTDLSVSLSCAATDARKGVQL